VASGSWPTETHRGQLTRLRAILNKFMAQSQFSIG
jgi:hypothetical protein